MVYNYTKPRGPIAAMFNSPGPCYALPGLVGYKRHDPRSVHARGPAYPISGRHDDDGSGGGGRRASSPGPAAYHPDSRTLRTGRDGTPRYTISGRFERSGRSVTPGPGAYAPERAGPSARRCVTPSFSFGVKGRERSYDDIPGPNQYAVPSMLCRTVQSDKRQAPAYSLSSRSRVGSFHEDYQKTPGPGAYKVTDLGIFKSRPPSCRIASRNLPPSDDTRKPGPGAHSPERVWVHKQYSPQFTFGIRHSPYSSPLIVRTGEF